jgi:hypothetical protein
VAGDYNSFQMRKKYTEAVLRSKIHDGWLMMTFSFLYENDQNMDVILSQENLNH